MPIRLWRSVMRQSLVILASLATASAAALGGYWRGQAHASRGLVQPESAVASTGADGRSEENERVVEALRQLDRRVAALELRQMLVKESEPRAPVGAPGQDEPTRLDSASVAARQQARAAAIEQALRTEPRDGAWAAATEGELRNAVDAAGKDGAAFSLKSLRCLTSICEMVLSASDPEQFSRASLQLDPRITGMSSFAVAPPETAADGSATMTYRLFREGYPRPDEGT